MTLTWSWVIPRSWQCQNITSVCYLIYFCHIRQCWHKVDLKGVWKKPSNPFVISVTTRGWFGVGLCWDLGMFQAIVEISSEQNVSKNNKNKLVPPVLSRFDPPVLSWCDLEMTLPWPWDNSSMVPNTNRCHMCTWRRPYQNLGITP